MKKDFDHSKRNKELQDFLKRNKKLVKEMEPYNPYDFYIP